MLLLPITITIQNNLQLQPPSAPSHALHSTANCRVLPLSSVHLAPRWKAHYPKSPACSLQITCSSSNTSRIIIQWTSARIDAPGQYGQHRFNFATPAYEQSRCDTLCDHLLRGIVKPKSGTSTKVHPHRPAAQS